MTNQQQRKPTRVEFDFDGRSQITREAARALADPRGPGPRIVGPFPLPSPLAALSLYYWPPNQLAFALRNREVYPFKSQASANGLGEVEK